VRQNFLMGFWQKIVGWWKLGDRDKLPEPMVAPTLPVAVVVHPAPRRTYVELRRELTSEEMRLAQRMIDSAFGESDDPSPIG